MSNLRYASAVAAAILLVGTGVAACSTSDGDATTENVEVISVLTDLTLEHLTVAVGTTVIWTNEDVQYHTITSGTAEERGTLWDSGILKRGESFRYKFQGVGTFDYFCTLHPQAMGGSVTVTE